jgi:MOSC domain-containing protein
MKIRGIAPLPCHDMLAAGRVTELHRWPVKSMAGQPVGALRLDERGAAGDRAHALFDEFKGAPRRLTARQVPRMLLWRAAYEGEITPADVPRPTLTAPDGTTFGWDDAGLPDALAADLGRPVALRRDLGLMQDLGHTLLVTTQATLDAIERALGAPLDLRRFRTNAHVVLDDAPAYAEEGWEGRELTIGAASFRLLHPCERCVIPTRDPDTAQKWAELLRWLTRERGGLFGMNARPVHAARIAVGDPVSVR